MPAANIIQLRQLMAERFPTVRTRLDDLSMPAREVWSTGVPPLDLLLQGGLPRSAMIEVVAARQGSGSATLLRALVLQALTEKKLVALIDGTDSFEVTALGQDLSRLLWVRCRSAVEAIKAADLLLRDGNLPLVLLDLVSNPAADLRKIQATTWYRFHRIVEQTAAICVVLTPNAMVSPAQVRVTLHSQFSLDALERNAIEISAELKVKMSETRGVRDRAALLHSA